MYQKHENDVFMSLEGSQVYQKAEGFDQKCDFQKVDLHEVPYS